MLYDTLPAYHRGTAGMLLSYFNFLTPYLMLTLHLHYQGGAACAQIKGLKPCKLLFLNLRVTLGAC